MSDHVETHDEDNLPEHGELYGVLAEYDTPGELVEAAKKVRDAGYTDFDCYSPFPVHGIDDAMGIKRTILPVLIFGGGFTGTLSGIALQWYCNSYQWKWNISGKPIWSLPANIPIAFELTILLSVLTAFFGMWALNKLPQVWHPYFRNERFGRVTDDAFLIGIEASDKRFDLDTTKKLLTDAGAIAIDECHLDPDPKAKVMPKWILACIISSTAFALIPFAIAAKARNSHSSEPHWHIFPDMDFQPKYKSDQPMDMFADGRENRGEIPGTVARGALKADDTFYRGLVDDATCDQQVYPQGMAPIHPCWTTTFPKTYADGRTFVVDRKLVERGQNRFEIYCTPCHGFDGRGHGSVPERVKQGGGAWEARNLVDPALTPMHMPNGQLFNTISNGYNTMQGYAAQIPVADRWAIVTYVRALQRAQNAAMDPDVPPEQRGGLQMPPMQAPTEAPKP